MERQSEDGNGGKRWRASVTKAISSPPDKVWKLAADFVGWDKWSTHLATCQHIEGEVNKAGCVRYLGGNAAVRADKTTQWVKEKLLTMDPANHSFTYTVVDGNRALQGFHYVASFKLRHGDGTCPVVEWNMETNPSDNSSEDLFVRYSTYSLEKMIQSLDEAAASD